MSEKQKGKSHNSKLKMKRFLSANWVNLATLLIALFALFVSIQSNSISQEANRIASESADANLRLATGLKSDDVLIVNVFGCYSRVTYKYQLVRYIRDNVTLSNTGGRATALIAVDLNDGSGRDYSIKLYNEPSFTTSSPPNRNEVKLPIQFDSGETRLLYIDANNQFGDSYADKQLALQAARKLTEEPSKAVWTFTFADGTVVRKEYKRNFYSVSPFIESGLDTDCSY